MNFLRLDKVMVQKIHPKDPVKYIPNTQVSHLIVLSYGRTTEIKYVDVLVLTIHMFKRLRDLLKIFRATNFPQK